ncbi:MAG TPA: AarF/ABC1/UbiB kinase family protein [Vicinamibacterales bacterium]|nr:AarF/ABC1/UbiB kinase family protein [Vicinamibacterales bacterium]
MAVLPEKLSRYAAVASLMLKYGRNVGATVDDDVPDEAPEALANDLEKLGPTFIKLGQVLSTRPDLLPPSYLEALTRLQDSVKPFPFADVQRIVEEELGARLSKAFSVFEETPIAAASLGQVHRAALRDGRAVAVKVQRPDIAKTVANDLAALDEIAQFLTNRTGAGRKYDLVGMVAEFRIALEAELDYQQEANNLKLIAKNLEEFEAIVIPQPVEGYISSRVLTMNYVAGTKVTKISPVARLEIQGDVLADTLVRAYLKQIVIDGVFHADPHPGNVFVTEDGLLALIDLGMVGRLSPQMQDRLLKMLLAISEGRGEEAADVAVTLGEKLPEFNEAGFRRAISALVGRIGHQSIAEFQIGRVFLELSSLINDNAMRAPAELTMLGKTLLHLDEVARVLDPALDVNECVRRNGVDLMSRRMKKMASSGSLIAAVLEGKEFAAKLPGRVNRVLDALAASELKMKVELIDDGAIIDGLQKVANRITLGLILAAMIVSAAMVMRVDTTFRILGYPGFAMILFLLAGAGATYLAVQIVRHDRSVHHR